MGQSERGVKTTQGCATQPLVLPSEDLWPHIRQYVVPPLSFSSHKGQSGKIGVIGGSVEYTGAPFYAAFSALKAGADLAFVYCTLEAAGPIKSYSPELIVYPILATEEAHIQESIDNIGSHLVRLTALVIGPGLGRASATMKVVSGVIRKASELDIPLILDGVSISLRLLCLPTPVGRTLAIE